MGRLAFRAKKHQQNVFSPKMVLHNSNNNNLEVYIHIQKHFSYMTKYVGFAFSVCEHYGSILW
jgi:hypothetical protein